MHGHSSIRSIRVATRKWARRWHYIVGSPGTGTASIEQDGVLCRYIRKQIRIPYLQIHAVNVHDGLFWSRIEFTAGSNSHPIAGLNADEARDFEKAVLIKISEASQAQLDLLRPELTRAISFLDALKDPDQYVRFSEFGEYVSVLKLLVERLPRQWPGYFQPPEMVDIRRLVEFLNNHQACREHANQTFRARELKKSKTFFDQLLEWPLTPEQRSAVVTDEDRSLVIAAAGSGKTALMVAKVSWLDYREQCRPDEMLLMAYSHNAAEELKRRVGNAAANSISIKTFHSLGLHVIGNAEGVRPSLAKWADDPYVLSDLLFTLVHETVREEGLEEDLFDWFAYNRVPYGSRFQFSSEGEYINYIRKYELITLKREIVKSLEECFIANWLYRNGIEYEYEAKYCFPTATPDYAQYKPDFYLPKNRIYIEHFAIGKGGRVAPFIDQDKYLSGMEWKRELHRKNGTTLIETYSYQISDDTLLTKLEQALRARQIEFDPIPDENLFEILNSLPDFSPFVRLLGTFIKLFKEARISNTCLQQRIGDRSPTFRKRAKAFLKLFLPVFNRYQQRLNDEGEIDFEDMIQKAVEHITARRFVHPYLYVLVDEFQDISIGRAQLISALLNQNPSAQLFAVGDDWQAIYRFAGGDISIMREFQKWFGFTAQMNMGTTFRCVDRISKIASRFIQANPSQLRKEVASKRSGNEPAVHLGFPKAGFNLLEHALTEITHDAEINERTGNVLLLGRYNHVSPDNLFPLKRKYWRLSLEFSTIHSAKGLEADYVVILNVSAGKYGFPSEITDDPLLYLILARDDNYENAEERRLFYVALTRARYHVYLLAEGGPPSPFVMELYRDRSDIKVFGREPDADVLCTACETGHFILRTNSASGKRFFGCSNYPYCENNQPVCPDCDSGPIRRDGPDAKCNSCGQTLVTCPECKTGLLCRKTGKYGPFRGCSRYPSCKFTA